MSAPPGNDRWTKAPLWLALGFLALFVLIPLAILAKETLFGPEGFTLDAWRGARSRIVTFLVSSSTTLPRALQNGLGGTPASSSWGTVAETPLRWR